MGQPSSDASFYIEIVTPRFTILGGNSKRCNPKTSVQNLIRKVGLDVYLLILQGHTTMVQMVVCVLISGKSQGTRGVCCWFGMDQFGFKKRNQKYHFYIMNQIVCYDSLFQSGVLQRLGCNFYWLY